MRNGNLSERRRKPCVHCGHLKGEHQLGGPRARTRIRTRCRVDKMRVGWVGGPCDCPGYEEATRV